MNLRVAAVIPAHNEESTIRHAVEDIEAQTYPVQTIVVVNDCSTDGTGDILAEMQFRHPNLIVITNSTPRLRAGALNCGLEYLADKSVDVVLCADADSRFDYGLIAEAVECFRRYSKLGGVCSTAGVLDVAPAKGSRLKRIMAWLLWRLQRLDCAGFDAVRTATWSDVQILHGLCSVFRFAALKEVGGYSPGHLLEDYDLTIRLKRAGWRAMFCPRMKAWTKVPNTLKGLVRQRLRWMRGGMDILLQYGLNRFTWTEFLQHALFLMLFSGILTYVALTAFSVGWQMRLMFHPLTAALAGVNYIWSLYRLRYVDRLGVADVVIRSLLLPELVLAMILSFFQMAAYYLSLFRRPQKW